MPNLPTPQWDLPLFWHFTRWFLTINNVWIMICVGLILAALILTMIIELFHRKDDEDKDEEDYDMI